MNKEKIKKVLKSKITLGVGCFLLGGMIMSGSPSEEATSALNKQPELQAQVTTLGEKITTLEKDKTELQAKVDEAKPWFEKTEAERKVEEDKLAQEKKAKEEEEAKVKAEQEAQAKADKEAEEQAKKEAEAHKYETGITYEDIARNPAENMGKLLTFKGKIV